MNTKSQNPDSEKAREYQEIQQTATQRGSLAGIDTHVSSEAGAILDDARQAPLIGGKDNSTPGLGRGVEGTGVMGINQKDSTSKDPAINEDDCGCGDIDQKTINDAIEEVGD